MKVQRNQNGHILWTDSLLNFIIANRDNISYISRETGIRKQTISKKLTELGYKERTRGHVRQYHCNEHAFQEIDTVEKAYYLGLLAADGSLNKKSSLIRLSLHQDDKYLLEQFNRFVESDRPIFQSKNSSCCEACINSFIMQQDLLKLGIGYDKSYNLTRPRINDKMGKAFTLGLFDGDGSITISHKGDKYLAYEFKVIGTKDILSYIVNFLYIYDGKYTINLEHNCSSTYQLRVSGNYRVYTLLKDLYSNNFDKPMKRKYDRFLQLQNMAPRRRNSPSKLS